MNPKKRTYANVVTEQESGETTSFVAFDTLAGLESERERERDNTRPANRSSSGLDFGRHGSF